MADFRHKSHRLRHWLGIWLPIWVTIGGPFTLVAVTPWAAHGQMHHVDAPERVTRAVGVYEWTGDLAKPTAARFVPVSLFIDGHLEDAGLYLARPVPFALQAGDVYALEHAGEPEGLLDLDYAQHVVTGQALQDDDPAGAWYGYGKFSPAAAPKLNPLQPSSHVPVIQSNGASPAAKDESGPHMSRRGQPSTPASGSGANAPGTANAGSGGQAKDSGTGGTAGTNGTGTNASTPASDDDTDRPTLRHRDPSQDATRRREYGNGSKGKQASVTAAGPAPGDDPDRPVLGRSQAADAGTPPLTGLPAGLQQAVAVSDSAHRDGHDFARAWDSPAERRETLAALEALARPRLTRYLAENRLAPSRGPLPVETGEAVAAPTNPSGSPGSSSTANATASPNSTPAPAVPAPPSADEADAATPPRLQRGVPSQYGAPGTPNTDVRTPKADIPTPKPVTHPPAAATNLTRPTPHRPATLAARQPVATLALQQAEVTGYSLTYGGLPTFVYIAAASVASSPAPAAARTTGRTSAGATAASRPAARPSTGSPATAKLATAGPAVGSPAAVYVTLVAQRLPSGELQIALSNVTDSLHLDRGPRLRLVDAVDPDDSHRASLLFELRGAASRQFALYRLTSAEAEQTFTTGSIE